MAWAVDIKEKLDTPLFAVQASVFPSATTEAVASTQVQQECKAAAHTLDKVNLVKAGARIVQGFNFVILHY